MLRCADPDLILLSLSLNNLEETRGGNTKVGSQESRAGPAPIAPKAGLAVTQ